MSRRKSFIAIAGTILAFLFVTLPQWASAVWSIFSDEPLIKSIKPLLEDIHLPMPQFSAFYITVPIGLFMFLALIVTLQGQRGFIGSNLTCRRILVGTLVLGRRSFATGYRAVFAEIGNDLLPNRKITSAQGIRASLKYVDMAGNVLQIVCPGMWLGGQTEISILAGESESVVLAVMDDSYKWATQPYNGISFDKCGSIEMQLINWSGQSLGSFRFDCSTGKAGPDIAMA